MADWIVALLYLCTAAMVGFALGVGWERRRWEEREHAEAMARLDRIGDYIDRTSGVAPTDGGQKNG